MAEGGRSTAGKGPPARDVTGTGSGSGAPTPAMNPEHQEMATAMHCENDGGTMAANNAANLTTATTTTVVRTSAAIHAGGVGASPSAGPIGSAPKFLMALRGPTSSTHKSLCHTIMAAS